MSKLIVVISLLTGFVVWGVVFFGWTLIEGLFKLSRSPRAQPTEGNESKDNP